MRGDQRYPLRRQLEQLDDAPIRRRVRLVGAHLLDAHDVPDLLGEAGRLEERPRLPRAAVRQDGPRDAGLLEPLDGRPGVRVRREPLEERQDVVGVELDAEARGRGRERRPRQIGERDEVAGQRHHRRGVEQPLVPGVEGVLEPLRERPELEERAEGVEDDGIAHGTSRVPPRNGIRRTLRPRRSSGKLGEMRSSPSAASRPSSVRSARSGAAAAHACGVIAPG